MAKLTGAELRAFDSNSEPGDGLFAELKDLADEPICDGATILIQDKDRFITTPAGNVGDVVQEALAIPVHWQPCQVDLLVHVRDGYPITPLDMFFVDPPLQLADGRYPANAGAGHALMGRTWQRFSWHYQRAWNPNRDNLRSHIRFCLARLQRPE